MNKTVLISSLLAVGCLAQSGCSIVTAIVNNKKANDKEAADAAEKKRLDEAVASKDLATLKTECGKSEGNTQQWCEGYSQVFAENVGAMQCDAGWTEFTGAVEVTGARTEMITAMTESLVECEKWDLIFTGLVPEYGRSALLTLDGRAEAPFLAHAVAGGALEEDVQIAMLDHLYDLQEAGKATGSCADYLGTADRFSDLAAYIRILVKKECKEAIPVFEKGLLSDHTYVRSNSCTGLAKVGTAKHVKPLQNLAWTDEATGSDYSMPVREACRDAFGKLETRLAM